jgi:tetratricopeptide (TPR) repeat protein
MEAIDVVRDQKGVTLPPPGAEQVNEPSVQPPLIARIYQEYLDNQDSTLFRREVVDAYTVGTLERLATHHKRKVRRAAILALGLIGDYSANHTMGRALLDEDRTVRTLAESGIRDLWARSGNDAQRETLTLIIRLNAAQRQDEVIRRATALIDESPYLAEAWFQRATAHFRKQMHAEAIRDCHEALEINPYHFAAATTMGQAYMELENYVSALESFRRALRLNPDLEGVRIQVVRLARMVED